MSFKTSQKCYFYRIRDTFYPKDHLILDDEHKDSYHVKDGISLVNSNGGFADVINLNPNCTLTNNVINCMGNAVYEIKAQCAGCLDETFTFHYTNDVYCYYWRINAHQVANGFYVLQVISLNCQKVIKM